MQHLQVPPPPPVLINHALCCVAGTLICEDHHWLYGHLVSEAVQVHAEHRQVGPHGYRYFFSLLGYIIHLLVDRLDI